MKKNLLVAPVLIFVLMTCMAFLPDSNSKNNCSYFDNDTVLFLSKPQERMQFILEKPNENQVLLCGLEVGKNYDLYISEMGGSCPSPVIFLNKTGGVHLRITPSSECYELSIFNYCDSKKEVSLSVAKESDRNNTNVVSSPEFVPITTSSSNTVTQLIEDVFIGGGCFDVSNVQLIGSSQGVGSFGNGLNSLGFDEGVVLSSGNISDVSGPNNSASSGINIGGGSDTDLATLTSQQINDASGIEFDFSPTLSTIEFKFVFASEEYCEFVNTQFNDVFGFFISGPGINGPFSNNGENIALVPSSTTPITINSVNHLLNTTYFLPNSSGCGGTTNSADIEFDGYTTILTATANVIPCETYHIRLVVGDGSDAIYDSAVFLEAGSFSAGGQATVEAVGSVVGSNVIYEGCGGGEITFTREAGDINIPLVVTYTLSPSSTATPGIDYTPIPFTVTIPAGQTQITIPITAFQDNIPEGIETIILELDNSCSCVNNIAIIEISDNVPINVTGLDDQSLCGPQVVNLIPTITGGVLPYSYIWSTGQTSPTISPYVTGTTTYTVLVTDACGSFFSENVTIDLDASSTAVISGNVEICSGVPANVLQIDFTGTGPWNVFYSLNGFPQTPLIGVTDNPYYLLVSQTGTYTITQLSSAGCTGVGGGVATVSQTVITTVALPTNIGCTGNGGGSISVIQTGGTAPYNYIWSDLGIGNQSTPSGLSAGTYTVTVEDANGCTGETSTTITQPDPIIASAVGSSVDCNNPNGGTVDLTVTSGGSSLIYVWSNGFVGEDLSGLSAGTYTVTITNSDGCTTTAFGVVDSNIDEPIAVANAPVSLDCDNAQVSISGVGSSTGTNFTYQWTTSNGNIILGENTLSPIVNASGTYILLVTNTANSCIQVATAIVTGDPTIPEAVASAPTNLDCDNPQVFISGNGSSTGSNFTYQWTTSNGFIVSGENSIVPSVNMSGIYQLVVTNTINGCTQLAIATVTGDPTIPEATANAPTNLDCDNAQVSVSGAGSSTGNNFTYQWTTTNGNIISGENSLTPTVNMSGTYQLVVTNTINGCTQFATATVTGDATIPEAVASAPVNLDCDNPQVFISGNGSSTGNNFTYLWTTADGYIVSGENSIVPSVNMSGTYQLVVTNTINGCTQVATATVTGDAILPDAVANAPSVLDCNNMQISIDGNGSSTGNNFTYSWTTPNGNIISGETSLNPSVNMGGDYTLLVTNTNNGCQETASINISENLTPPNVNAGATQEINCNTSIVSLSGNGSTGTNFTYLWTTANGSIVSGETTFDPEVEAAGIYQLEITNIENGCTATSTAEVTLDENVPIADAGVAEDLTCDVLEIILNGNNSSTGTGYTYQWTTQNGNITNDETTLNPTIDAEGTYELLVTAPNGCISVSIVTVSDDSTPPVVDAGLEMSIDCSNSVVSLDGSGSSTGANFTYEWTTPNGNILSGENTLTPLVDALGDYILTITNTITGCTATSNASVNSIAILPNADAGATQLLDCDVLEITLDGENSETGTDITYLWTTQNGNILNGETTLTPTVDGAGIYVLVVSNTNTGCSSSSEVEVNQTIETPDAAANTTTPLSCTQTSVSLSGGGSSTGGNFIYQWTTQNGNIILGENTLSPEVNAAGIYEILVTNTTNGCTQIASIEVTVDGDLPNADAGIATDLTCDVLEITLDGTGSSGNNFTYSWTTTDGNIVSNQASLNPIINAIGTYELLVTDSDNGCTAISTISINDNMESPNLEAEDAPNLTCEIETINLSANNLSANSNFTYQWNTQNGNIISGENTLSPSVNEAGEYILQATNNANGCTSIIAVEVEIDNQAPLADAGAMMELTCENEQISLNGSGSDSGINITYQWTTQNGNIISGENTGDPTIGATGDYQLLVTNTDNGCTAISSVFVDENIEAPTANAGIPLTLSCAQNAVQLNGNGSSFGQNFIYEWTTQNGNIVFGENTLTPEINTAGDYQIQVTNTENGCTAIASIPVEQDSNAPTADAGLDDLLNCEVTNLVLDGGNSSTGIEFSYEWTTANGNIVFGENTLNPEINEAGEYQLVVTNNVNGCTSVSTLMIELDAATPNVEAGINQFLSCTNSSVLLNGTGSSTGSGYTYEWVTPNGNIISGGNTIEPEVNATGIYELIVTFENNGCTASDEVEILQDSSLPTADAGEGFEITCAIFEGNLDATASSINNDITFEWATQNGNIVSGENTLTPLVDAAGVYQLILTNTINGCTAISSATITENNNEPAVNAGATMELNCNNQTLLINGSTSDTSATLIYEWTTMDGNINLGENTLTPQISSAGTYELMILNTATGCSSFDQVIITENFQDPIADAGATDELNCTQAFATLDGNGSSTGNNFIYQWTTANGNIVSGENTLTPDVNQSGDYELVVTNLLNGCTATESVFISQNINEPVANVAVAADLTCALLSMELDGSNSSTGTDFEYLWTTADGNILMGNNTLNPIVDETGTYILQVTNTINNCISTAEITIDENMATPTADAGAQGLLTCTVTETTLNGNNSSAGNDITYEWTTTNGNIISGANTISPTVGNTGTYELIVTNTTTGCTSNSFVEVDSDGNIPNAIASPEGLLTCDETTIALNGNGSSAGNNFTYQWTTTNGNIISGGTTISPTVNQIGAYTLLVTDTNNGCNNEITIYVEDDLAQPSALIDQTGNLTLDCVTSSLVIDGSASQPFGGLSYAWTTIDGNILSGANTPNPEIDDDGTYLLTITNLINGCTAEESIIILQDLSVPQVDIEIPLVLTCDLTETILDASNSSIGNYAYQWTTTNGNIISGGNTLTPTVNQNGSYQLIITDLASNCENDGFSVVLENITPPTIDAGTADLLDCQTTSVTLTGSAPLGNNYIYEWSAGGNVISNTLSTTVEAAGNYTLLVSDTENGCTAIDEVIVEQSGNAIVGIIYDLDEPECFGDRGSIIIETVDGGSPPYLYSVDGVNFYSGHIFTLDAGEYTLYAQDSEGCETQTNISIPVLNPVSIILENEVTIELGDDYQIEAFTNIPTDEIASIKWTPNHNLSCDDCLNPMVKQLFETTTYTLKIINIYGCVVVSKITIIIDKSRAIYIPNIFTPNGDGNNDVFMIYAGDTGQIKQVNSFMIYDRWGEVVFRQHNFDPMNPEYGWDGMFKGEKMNPQVFVYWAEIEFIDGLKVMYKGDVTLRK